MRLRETGWSIVELMVSITVLVVGLLSLAAGLFGASRLNESTHDNYVLSEAYNNAVAALQTAPFSSLTASFGPGSPKQAFWVDQNGGLFYKAPTDSLAQGTIEIFNIESAMPTSWSGLATGLDLNANGKVDTGPVTNYLVLPVRITLTMDRRYGQRTFTADLILAPPGA